MALKALSKNITDMTDPKSIELYLIVLRYLNVDLIVFSVTILLEKMKNKEAKLCFLLFYPTFMSLCKVGVTKNANTTF